jgi:hypothetical protein
MGLSGSDAPRDLTATSPPPPPSPEAHASKEELPGQQQQPHQAQASCQQQQVDSSAEGPAQHTTHSRLTAVLRALHNTQHTAG